MRQDQACGSFGGSLGTSSGHNSSISLRMSSLTTSIRSNNPAAGRKERRDKSSKQALPNEWHQAVLHCILILPIARQIYCKKPLLIKKSPYEHRHDESEAKKSPP